MINKEEAKDLGINIIESNNFEEEKKNDLINKLKSIIPDVINSDNVLDINALSDVLDISKTTKNNQGYELTFAGKGIAKANVSIPTKKELSLNETQSKNVNTTENIIIRGDNLDALKLLKQSYEEQIKMIYIDPPYNTGGDDFAYNDNFKVNEQELIESFELNEDTINFLDDIYKTKCHSSWLSFMYPRLKIARDLLKDDGVIFISIDDNEQANLKIICDEIFGEDNVDVMIWRKSGAGRDGKMKNTTTFRKDHEYIIVCFKKENILNKSFEIPQWENKYDNPDNDERGAYKTGSISKKEEASNHNHKNYYTVISPTGNKITRQFEISKEDFDNLNNDNRIYWGKDGNSIPSCKIFENEKRHVNTSSAIIEKETNKTFINEKDATTTKGTKELNEILLYEGIGENLRPKPLFLLKKLSQIGSHKNDIILDFFAGSGTTGHAVMELNKEDSGSRKFIMIQKDEEIKEEKSKPAYDFCKENNFEPFISSITIERINRAGEKIKSENDNIDIGYKVFSLKDKTDITFNNNKLELEDHRKSSMDKIYNMLLKTNKSLSNKIEIIEKDALYKIDNVYYIINDFKSNIDDFKDNQIYIDGYSTISLEKYLNINTNGKDNIFIVF